MAFAAQLHGMSAIAQSADTLKHLPSKQIEITAQKETDLKTIDPRFVEVKPSNQLIQRTGSALAGEALRALSSSLDIRLYGPLGSSATASFRGLPSEYTIVYRDGIRLTNDQLGETDFGQLTLRGTSRVELVPTSTAVLMGNDAVGATINLVSQFADTSAIRLGSEATSYEHGEGFPGQAYYASISAKPVATLSIVADGSIDRSNGNFPFYQASTNSYVLRENNDAALRSADLNGEYSAGEGMLVRFISNYFSAERGVPGAATTQYHGASDLTARQADQQGLAAIKLEQGADVWHNTFTASYQNQFESYNDPLAGLHDSSTNALYELNASANTNINEWLRGYTGIDYLHSQLTGSTNTTTSNNPAIGRDQIGGYIAASIEPMEAIRIAASLNPKYISDISSFKMLPQVSCEIDPWRSIMLRGAYSKSFHAPTMNDLYWKGLGNPNLLPERADNWEASIATSPLPLARRGILSAILAEFSATYFHARIRDEIVWTPDVNSGGAFRPINIGIAQSEGLELRASGSIPLDERSILHIEESYTFLGAHNLSPGDTNFGKELTYSSPTSSLFIAQFENNDLGSLAAMVRYRGHKYSDPANTLDGELPPVTTIDLTLATRDFRLENVGFHIMLSIQNLTDQHYVEIINYPLPDRTYKISIELNYH